MSQQIRITHYYHSGFSIEWEQVLFVFDYWRGENHELPPEKEIQPEMISRYRQVYVFITHEHADHLDPIVFTWKDYGKVNYIVSADMPVGTRGKRMAVGDQMELISGVWVKAFDSTDLGVSFLLDLKGLHIFHAGDLNFWHWREESTLKEIEEAEEEFRRAVSPLPKEKIDIAFFPVDPRQGTMFEAGANYFILSVKPRLFIPMHYFRRAEVIMEYARTASNAATEVLAMVGLGDRIQVEQGEDGYLTISFPKDDEISVDLLDPDGENPFDETDLPLSQLVENEENRNPSDFST